MKNLIEWIVTYEINSKRTSVKVLDSKKDALAFSKSLPANRAFMIERAEWKNSMGTDIDVKLISNHNFISN